MTGMTEGRCVGDRLRMANDRTSSIARDGDLKCGASERRPVVFSLQGEREQYVRCKLDSIEVSLYADGFDLQGEGLDVRYEPDDIGSPAGAVALLSGELRAALAP